MNAQRVTRVPGKVSRERYCKYEWHIGNALLCQHYGLSGSSELVCPACVYKNWFCICFIKQSFLSANSGCRANTPYHLEMELFSETKTTILCHAWPGSDCLNSPSSCFLFTVGTVFDLQFTIFIQVSFKYICSTVCFWVSYLVGLISWYRIDVFKSRFNVSANSVQVEQYSEAWERLHMKTWIRILCVHVSQPQVCSLGT